MILRVLFAFSIVETCERLMCSIHLMITSNSCISLLCANINFEWLSACPYICRKNQAWVHMPATPRKPQTRSRPFCRMLKVWCPQCCIIKHQSELGYDSYCFKILNKGCICNPAFCLLLESIIYQCTHLNL